MAKSPPRSGKGPLHQLDMIADLLENRYASKEYLETITATEFHDDDPESSR